LLLKLWGRAGTRVLKGRRQRLLTCTYVGWLPGEGAGSSGAIAMPEAGAMPPTAACAWSGRSGAAARSSPAAPPLGAWPASPCGGRTPAGRSGQTGVRLQADRATWPGGEQWTARPRRPRGGGVRRSQTSRPPALGLHPDASVFPSGAGPCESTDTTCHQPYPKPHKRATPQHIRTHHHTSPHTHVFTHTHTHARAHTHTHTHIHTHKHARMRARTHTHTWGCSEQPPNPHPGGET
jgi:hypothetical protein